MMGFKLILLQILAVILFGCDMGCEKVHFTTREIQWFDVYEQGQVLVFKSNLGRYDTLKINSKEIDYTDCNRFEQGKYQYNYAAIRFSSKLLGDLSHCKFEKNDQDAPCSKCFRLGDLIECYENLDTDLPTEYIFSNLFKERIKSYRIDTSNADSLDDHLVKSFNWSSKYGLIRYVINEDEIFELIKN